MGGDSALYTSAIEELDELIYCRDIFGNINSMAPQLFQSLMSQMTTDEASQFNLLMGECEQLRAREEEVRKHIEQIDLIKGKRH